ncbi:MAG TPA: YHS domain-containing protein [Thiobacillus sp.]
MEKDPVCGMLMDPRDVTERRVYQGKEYYFCSPDCAGKFDQAPERYAAPQPPAKPEVEA